MHPLDATLLPLLPTLCSMPTQTWPTDLKTRKSFEFHDVIFGSTQVHVCIFTTPYHSHDWIKLCIQIVFAAYRSFGIKWTSCIWSCSLYREIKNNISTFEVKQLGLETVSR
jgi:hypothetical protein